MIEEVDYLKSRQLDKAQHTIALTGQPLSQLISEWFEKQGYSVKNVMLQGGTKGYVCTVEGNVEKVWVLNYVVQSNNLLLSCRVIA